MTTFVRSGPPLDLPRPGRAAAPFLVLCAAALGFVADPRLPWIAGGVAALSFAAAAAVRAAMARRELAGVRRAADRQLLRTARAADASPLLAWRAAELTAPSERARLRREVERTLQSLAPGRLPSASPLRRPAARRNVELLRVLAERLGDGRPVGARGVLLARGLLRDVDSPLYNDGADLLLPRALTRVIGALEP
jgi:hypothetical protein